MLMNLYKQPDSHLKVKFMFDLNLRATFRG